MNKLFIIALTALHINAAFSMGSRRIHHEEQPIPVTYDSGVKADERQMIQEDLEYFKNLQLAHDPELNELLQIDQTKAQTLLEDWLAQRFKVVLGKRLSTFSLLMRYRELENNVVYPFPNILPITLELEQLHEAQESFNVAMREVEEHLATNPNLLDLESESLHPDVHMPDYFSKGQVVMANMGAALYMMGKINKTRVGFRLGDKRTIVELHSPRVGMVQIGKGLLMNRKRKGFENYARLTRLDTYFHEARHSDGHAESLSFPHVTCPAGHDYALQPACDINNNGPYKVGYTILKAMAHVCAECNISEREALRLAVLDGQSRLIPTWTQKDGNVLNSTWWDPAPEGLRPELLE